MLAETLLQRPARSLNYLFVELSMPAEAFIESIPFESLVAELRYLYRADRLVGRLPQSAHWLNTYLMALLSPRRVLLDRLVPIPVRRQNPNLIFNGVGYDFVPSRTGYLRDKRLHSTLLAATLPALKKSHQLTKAAYNRRDTDPPEAYYQADVNHLLTLANTRGIHLLFYLPNRLTPDEARWLPAVFNQLPAANRLTLPTNHRFDTLFSPAFTFDRAHLNHPGAIHYTKLMAEAFERARAAYAVESYGSRSDQVILRASVVD